MASRCELCWAEEETSHHILLSCNFASQVWSKALSLFNEVWIGFPSLELLFSWWRKKAKVVLLADIWKALLIIICQQIWFERNKRRYDNQRSPPRQVVQRCINEISSCSIIKGVTIKSVNDLMLAKIFKVSKATPKLKRVIEVRWKPPPMGWWKLNIDGSSFGNPVMQVQGESLGTTRG
ncbi:uncharacterized protein LOC122638638 [Telopea speciosissima]|uniref:uncharacterized protein LOC122638638 n=1 Tax=Telopea speciosissima TaxID=54955 RepID=UPI001CC56CEF|nr:uncharacterized protein LOC122638638 [Telopea speciosissima]